MGERNTTIKEYAKRNNVPLWMIAERYRGGVTDSYFSRLLRRKFSDDEEKKILSIIDDIAREMKSINEATKKRLRCDNGREKNVCKNHN